MDASKDSRPWYGPGTVIIIIINEIQLTWREVAKLQGHVTKKRVTCSVLGPKNAGKVQASADIGTAAAMWMPVRLLGGCSRRPVQQRQKHGHRLSNAACDGQPMPRSSQSEVAAVSRHRRRGANRPTDRLVPCHGGSGTRARINRPMTLPRCKATHSQSYAT